MIYFVWISTAILTLQVAHSYVLLTANLEDIQAIAKQLSSSPLSESINKIWRRAASQFNQQLKYESQPQSLGYMRSNDDAPPQEPAYQGDMKRSNNDVLPQEPIYQSSNNMKTANEDVSPLPSNQAGSFAPEDQQQQLQQRPQQLPQQQRVPQQYVEHQQQQLPQEQQQLPQQQQQLPQQQQQLPQQQQQLPQQQQQLPQQQQQLPQQQQRVPQQYYVQQQQQLPQQPPQQYVETIRNDEPLPADDINQDIQQPERSRQSDELVGNERKSSIYLKPLRRTFEDPSV